MKLKNINKISNKFSLDEVDIDEPSYGKVQA